MSKSGLGKSRPITIFLLGDIAAGKGTHSAFLKKRYNCSELDIGQEMRKLKISDPKRAASFLSKTLDKGKLIQTDIAREIMREFIYSAQKTKGLLFSGNPKMLGEARLVRKWLAETGRSADMVLVIYLKITKAEIIKRMSRRAVIERRSDDNLKALEKRLRYYNKNISAVCDYFKKHFTFKSLSSMGEVSAVEKNIEQSINAFILVKNTAGNRADSRKRQAFG